MTSKKKQQNKRGCSFRKGEWKSTRSKWEDMNSDMALQMIDTQPSSGYSGKYCSLNTVTNAEGLCLAGVSLVFF